MASANQIETPDVVTSLDDLNERMRDLMKTRAWAALSPQQKSWCRNVLATNGDYLLATRLSYNAKSDKNCRTITVQVRNNPDVQSALALFFPKAERDERKEFFDKLQRRLLQGKISIADVEICKRVCAERGWNPPTNLPPGMNSYIPVAQRRAVGETVTQQGYKFRVTSVDAHGKVLAAEPFEE